MFGTSEVKISTRSMGGLKDIRLKYYCKPCSLDTIHIFVVVAVAVLFLVLA